MNKKQISFRVLVLVCGILLVLFASCKTESGPPALNQLLRTYMAPRQENWGGDSVTYVYYVDPNRFAAFKAELDEGGEYHQTNTFQEERDWDTGKTFARWAERADGTFELDLCKADNFRIQYTYGKYSSASGQKLKNSLSNYMVPKVENWSEVPVKVYSLDPNRFAAFKAQLDEGGEYHQTSAFEGDRDWETEKYFARWAERADGTFQLDLCKADNSRIEYNYTR
jgi:hypothetical protein